MHCLDRIAEDDTQRVEDRAGINCWRVVVWLSSGLGYNLEDSCWAGRQTSGWAGEFRPGCDIGCWVGGGSGRGECVSF
jgi:hypothetical protein